MFDNNTLSKSEQMYLVTIRQFCENCTESSSIPIPDIAAKLDVQPVSANQMVKKLEDAGVVQYTPYKGVALTEDGQAISTRILRHRRLWEVFLVRSLKMDLDEADALACQLEHVTSSDVANRLSNFLDDPSVCFHGLPIYSPEDTTRFVESVSLKHIQIGQPFQIIHITGDENTVAFLAEQHISPGNRGSILAANDIGSLLVQTAHGSSITMTKEIAEKIIVEELNV